MEITYTVTSETKPRVIIIDKLLVIYVIQNLTFGNMNQ